MSHITCTIKRGYYRQFEQKDKNKRKWAHKEFYWLSSDFYKRECIAFDLNKGVFTAAM